MSERQEEMRALRRQKVFGSSTRDSSILLQCARTTLLVWTRHGRKRDSEHLSVYFPIQYDTKRRQLVQIPIAARQKKLNEAFNDGDAAAQSS